MAALALALGGDANRAQTLADDLASRFPEDTWVQSVWIPTIRAQVALERKDPAKAIELLQAPVPYELQFAWQGNSLNSAAVRANAYMVAQKGNEAAAEFQRILDHPGIIVNRPIGPLARVGLARAYAMQGDAAKARTAYQVFLTLWKDADPDIPILKQAKAECAKLR
jgi:predicted Zn-dependent protease